MARVSRHQGKLFPGGLGDSGPLSGRESKGGGSGGGGGGDGSASSAEVSALEEQLGREEASELQEMFRLVDKDQGGSVSQMEFMELLHSMAVRPSPAEQDLMFGELDSSNDGVISYAEFLRFMTQPGVASASGAELLRAFRHMEACQFERGVLHPATSGRTGRAGVLHVAELARALRLYLPDKLPTERDATELLKPLHPDKRTGLFDYQHYVAKHVRPETMPPRNPDTGEYAIEPPPRPRRKRAAALQLQALVDGAAKAGAESGAQSAAAASEGAAAQAAAASTTSPTAADPASNAAASASTAPGLLRLSSTASVASVVSDASSPDLLGEGTAAVVAAIAAGDSGRFVREHLEATAARVQGPDVEPAQVEAAARKKKSADRHRAESAKKKKKDQIGAKKRVPAK